MLRFRMSNEGQNTSGASLALKTEFHLGEKHNMQSRHVTRSYNSILPALAALLTLGLATPAHAVLQRVGPTSSAPSIGGDPDCQQDTPGLSPGLYHPADVSGDAWGSGP